VCVCVCVCVFVCVCVSTCEWIFVKFGERIWFIFVIGQLIKKHKICTPSSFKPIQKI